MQNIAKQTYLIDKEIYFTRTFLIFYNIINKTTHSHSSESNSRRAPKDSIASQLGSDAIILSKEFGESI